jgi:hypothetical protein
MTTVDQKLHAKIVLKLKAALDTERETTRRLTQQNLQLTQQLAATRKELQEAAKDLVARGRSLQQAIGKV